MELNSFEILRNIKDDDLKLFVKLFYVFNTYNKTSKIWSSNVLFVTIDDKVFGFGQNNYGVCGQGHDERIEEPVIIDKLCDEKVKEFYIGFDFVLCLTNHNELLSWGMNDHGQLGIECSNKNGTFYWPRLITSLSDVNIVQVCCGDRHSLVLTEEGVVYGWGDNRWGQTGVGLKGEEMIYLPRKWIIENKIAKIHSSRYQSFAITESGRVYCCGINDEKQLGSQIAINDYVFTPILHDNVQNVESILTSNNNTYFVTKYGEIYFNLKYCEKNIHYFNDICKDDIFVRIIDSYETISLFYSNNNLNCFEYAITCSGDIIYELHEEMFQKTYYKTPEEYFAQKYQITYKTVKRENEYSHQELHPGKSPTEKYLPRYMRCENQIDKFEICDKIHENLKKIIKYLYVFISSPYNSNVLFVTIDDKVFGLGENVCGVLGLGHNNEVKEVEIIPELCDKRVKEFVNGGDFVLCLTSDNELFSWGKNDYGQLGNGHSSYLKISKPELIEYFKDKNIIQVCCNEYHSSVLTSDGNVYLWGRYDDEFFDHPVKCEFVEEINSIHCSREVTLGLTKSGNVNYWCSDKNQSFNTIYNVKTICSSDDYLYLISYDLIYILYGVFDSEEVIKKINLGHNFNAISHYSNCVIYNNNCVYELFEEDFETKYKTPFDYYCDKEKLTPNTIELNVKEEDIINANQTTNYFMINFIDRENDFIKFFKPYSIANKIGILKSFIKYFHIFRDEKGYNMLFVTNESNVYAFGENSYGNCGFGHNNSVSEPTIIKELFNKNVFKFFGGFQYIMALTNDNVLYAWGRISEPKNIYYKPTKIIEFENEIENISCSDSYALILMKDGIVFGWGDNSYGQIYDGNLEFISTPLKFNKLPKIKLITCNKYYSVFLSEDNRIFILGKNPDSYSSEDEDSKEICLNECDYYNIIKFDENLLNIGAGFSDENCIYLLTTKKELFRYHFKMHNKKFNSEFKKLFSDVESIYSFFHYYEDEHQFKNRIHDLLVVKKNGITYCGSDQKFYAHYKTLYDFFAQELQITYKTIDLNFQNEILRNDLQIKGYNNFEIEIILY